METYREAVARILVEYERSPEVAHDEEDELLHRYVLERARKGDQDAEEILPLLEAERIKWYA